MKTIHEIEADNYAIEMKSACDTYETAHHAIRGVYLDALTGPSVTKLVEALEQIMIISDKHDGVHKDASFDNCTCAEEMYDAALKALEEWRK